MRTKSTDQLELAQERLELRIEKQKYILLQDYTKIKHTYHPIRFASNMAIELLHTDENELDQPFLAASMSGKKQRRVKQFKNFRDLLLNFFLLIESYFSTVSETENVIQDTKKSPKPNPQKDYIIGQDDV